MEQFAKRMRDMASGDRRAQQQRQQAERYKELARKMYENATPEQRREVDKLLQEMAREAGGHQPGDEPAQPTRVNPNDRPNVPTRAVDARPKPPTDRPGPNGRVIAEWFSSRPGDTSGSAAAAEDLRRAADSAERASEQQVIPPRYNDLIKRVFKRYSEQVPAGQTPAPPGR